MDGLYFSNTVKKILKEKGIAANKMLHSLEINRNFFNDIIKRGSSPSIDSVSAIADFLDVPLDLLLNRHLDVTPDCKTTIVEDDIELLRRFHSLDSEGQLIVQAALIQESRRVQQRSNLDVSVNPNPPLTSGRDKTVAHPDPAPLGGVKKPEPKQKKAL